MTDTDQDRAAFEAWARGRGLSKELDCDDYEWESTYWANEGWQAALTHARAQGEPVAVPAKDIAAPPPEPAKAEVVEEEYRAHFGYSYGNDCWWVRVHGCKTESEAQSLRKRILSALATPPAAPAAPRSAAEEMRERCAKVAEGSYLPAHMSVNQTWGEASNTRAFGIAKAIRALPLPGEEA